MSNSDKEKAFQFLIDKMKSGASYSEALTAFDKGFRLYMARIRKGLSIHEAAQALNISEASMMDYEQGKRAPRDSTKKAIAALYCVPVPSLFF